MTKLDYENWLLKHCPEGVDIDDFVDSLAKGCIQIIEAAHDKTKTPIKAILAGFYDNDSH